MDISQLKYFISVAQTLNFSEAARRNGISQPAISHHIGELEKQLGCRLFERSRRSVVMTEQGREFLPYAAAEQERVKAAPTLEDGEDGESLFFVSCVPWLSYTALTQPTPTPADSNPRITWGRWHRQEGRTLLPMTLLANHALVDGIHIARFYENLDRELAALCGGEKTEY